MDRRSISIVIPIHKMENAHYFLERNLTSIALQNFRDYEIVISDDCEDETMQLWIQEIMGSLKIGCVYLKNPRNKGMANNTNNAIDNATGELIKILYLDDYFYHRGSLSEIMKHFTPMTWWLATGCTHTLDGVNTFNDHRPYFSESANTIGSPSVITFRRSIKERLDPNFHWVLDLDWYKQLYRGYGKPKIYDAINVVIGVGTHQMTNILTEERKHQEHLLLKLKYEQATVT